MARDEMRRAELLSALIDGELNNDERREAEAMIATDPEARALFEKLQALSRATAEERVPGVPATLAAKISERVRDADGELVRPPRSRWLRPHWMTAAAGIAAAVVVAVLAFHQWHAPIGKVPSNAGTSGEEAAAETSEFSEQAPVRSLSQFEKSKAVLPSETAPAKSAEATSLRREEEGRQERVPLSRRAGGKTRRAQVNSGFQPPSPASAPTMDLDEQAVPSLLEKGTESSAGQTQAAPADSEESIGYGKRKHPTTNAQEYKEYRQRRRKRGSLERAFGNNAAAPGVPESDSQQMEGRTPPTASDGTVPEDPRTVVAPGTKLICRKIWIVPDRIHPARESPKDAPRRLQALVVSLGGEFDREDPALSRIPKAQWPVFLEQLPSTGYKFLTELPPPPKECGCIEVRLEKDAQ